jgi:hypothetical protein
VQVDVEGLTLDLDLARSNCGGDAVGAGAGEGQLERARQLRSGAWPRRRAGRGESAVARCGRTLAVQEEQIAAAERALEGAAVRRPLTG